METKVDPDKTMADFFATTSYNRTPADWRDTPATAADPDEDAKAPLEKVQRKRVVSVDPNRLGTKIVHAALERIITEFLKEASGPIIKSAVAACSSLMKTSKSDIDTAMGMVDFSVLNLLPARVRKTLNKVYADAGQEAIKITTTGVGVPHGDDSAWHQVHEDARDYAKFRSAEMVGMKYDGDGELVENPDAKWAISETTRESIRSNIERVVSGDLPITELSDTLRESYGFSSSRASNIARTEFNKANGEGALAGYIANGVKLKIWMTSGDEKVSDECAANEDQGPIPVEEEFESGDLTNPAHPSCRCNVSAHIDLGEDDSDDNEE